MLSCLLVTAHSVLTLHCLLALNYEVGGIYSFYMAFTELTLVVECGKGRPLRGVEPFERAIGRVHGRRLLYVGGGNQRMVGAFN